MSASLKGFLKLNLTGCRESRRTYGRVCLSGIVNQGVLSFNLMTDSEIRHFMKEYVMYLNISLVSSLIWLFLKTHTKARLDVRMQIVHEPSGHLQMSREGPGTTS